MDKIWLTHYPPSVPDVIDMKQYASLTDLFKKSCAQFKNKPALALYGTQITYLELEVYSRHFAAFLQNTLHHKKGDRLAIMVPNSFQFVIAFLGALRLGMVVVPMNPLNTPREMLQQLNEAKVDSLLILSDFLKNLQIISSDTLLKHIIVTDFADVFPIFKRLIIQSALKLVRYQKYVKSFFKKKCKAHSKVDDSCQQNNRKVIHPILFRNVLKQGRLMSLIEEPVEREDLALLQHTGGTTGKPKVAMLTHANMVANVIQCISWVKPALTVGEERVLIALPLYHIFSLTVCCISFFSIGGQGILIPDPRRIHQLIKVFKKENPTVMAGVNTLFNALMSQSNFKTMDFSRLHLTISGGMKLQKTVADRWQKITGKLILEGYGLTEASPVVCVNPINLKAFNGSVGFPLPSTDVSIRNEINEELMIGQVGELCVKGPQVMKGYLDQPEETQHIFTPDGWLKTGDVARVGQDGAVYLVDRKKDIIIVSGFNVYPNEVEEIISSIPGVLEVAVVGRQDEVSGEAIKAYVVKDTSIALTREDIISVCKKKLLPYKIPRFIEFRKTLPKSLVGKVLKHQLKAEDNE